MNQLTRGTIERSLAARFDQRADNDNSSEGMTALSAVLLLSFVRPIQSSKHKS